MAPSGDAKPEPPEPFCQASPKGQPAGQSCRGTEELILPAGQWQRAGLYPLVSQALWHCKTGAPKWSKASHAGCQNASSPDKPAWLLSCCGKFGRSGSKGLNFCMPDAVCEKSPAPAPVPQHLVVAASGSSTGFYPPGGRLLLLRSAEWGSSL